MPDVSLLETILALSTALGAGGTVGATIRRPKPGTPEDHEQRLVKLETGDPDCTERLNKLEARVNTMETTVAGAIGQLTESVNRQWKAVEKLTESVDGLKASVIELDVEARVERELRKQRAPTKPDKE